MIKAANKLLLLLAFLSLGLFAPAKADPIHMGAVANSILTSVSYINSAQPVAITIASGSTSNTATITAVGANAFLIYEGSSTTQSGTSPASTFGYVQLTNSTTVTATRNSSNSDTLTLYAVVVDPTTSLVSSVQQGTISITGTGTSNTTTITSVDTSRSVVFQLGSLSGLSSIVSTEGGVTLTNSTTVTAGRTSATSGTTTIGYVVVQFATGVINSVQQFSSNFSTTNAADTQTITSVNTSNSFIAYGGQATGSGSPAVNGLWYKLTNGTTVTITRNGTSSAQRTPYYTVVEFVAGVLSNVQRGSISLASASSDTATITSAATAKSFASYLGNSTTVTALQEVGCSLVQTNTTTLTAAHNTAGTSTEVVGYEIVTFN